MSMMLHRKLAHNKRKDNVGAVKNTAPFSLEEHINPPIETANTEYTKTELMRMSLAGLQQVALENGISNAEEKSGTDLKKELIAKFGL